MILTHSSQREAAQSGRLAQRVRELYLLRAVLTVYRTRPLFAPQNEDPTSCFEAREVRQTLAVRPPCFPQDSTLTLVGS